MKFNSILLLSLSAILLTACGFSINKPYTQSNNSLEQQSVEQFHNSLPNKVTDKNGNVIQ